MEACCGAGGLFGLLFEALLNGLEFALVLCNGGFRGVGAFSCCIEIGACVIEFGLELVGVAAVFGGLGG